MNQTGARIQHNDSPWCICAGDGTQKPVKV